jgi:hypothetical protein
MVINIPKFLILHHEAPSVAIQDNAKRFKIVDSYHKSLGWGGCGYQYFIERDGQIIQARQDNEDGAHTKTKNTTSIGICLAGNMDIQPISESQLKSLKMLIQQKMKQYLIFPSNVVGHRFFATYSLAKEGAQGKNITQWKTWDNTQPYKSCPGSKLTDVWITDLTKEEVVVNNDKCGQEKTEIQTLKGTIATLTNYLKSLIK